MAPEGTIDRDTGRIDLPLDRLAEFCRRWKITEMAVFGSAERGEMGPRSDVDLLVTFAPDAEWSLFDHFHMENELVQVLGREVDLVSREAVQESPNWIRRRHILSSARTIYAA
ncbi:MAG: nucleotidyltransferase domain-containing protein [Planctomycetes bacterium]|nr:nucleotidyltransferase domain-containing protein [Planctomycetota bacterium]